jgi:subtilisin
MDKDIQFIPDIEMQPIHVMQTLSQTTDWGLMQSNIPGAWAYTEGEGITIAVLDTGTCDHPDLRDNLLPALNFSGESDDKDWNGHQTHCMGIIAAANNDFGVVGVAPKAKILPIKVLGNGGNGSYENIIAGVNAAVDCNVDIISMSLGSSSAPPEFHTAIKRAAEAGIVIIAAAGNDAGAVNYPARYEEVIAVAALDPRGNMAHFSSHGPEIDAIAPGVDIYSTYLDNGYAKLNGTSQACPFIAGICALMMSWTRKNPNLKPICDYKDMLQRLDDVSSLESQNIVIGRSGDWGFGVPKFANMNFDK